MWRTIARLLGFLVVFAAAVGLSITIGFVGAPHGEQFDWRLCAEIGTALGTLLLAAYTAWLATTTRREVAVSIEQEAARNRPTVVVTPAGIGTAIVDPVSGESVPTLAIVIRNVGLGPALDLRLHAAHGEHVSSQEVIPVVAVGDVIVDRAISLSGIPEPSASVVLDELELAGDFEDRSRTTRDRIVVLEDAGLVDEVMAGRELASRRAWFELMPGTSAEVTYRRKKVIRYEPVIQNRGPGDAQDVIVELVSYEDGSSLGASDTIAHMAAHSQAQVTIRLPSPQPRVTCRLSWRDAVGPRERPFEGVYPACGRMVSP